VSSTGNGGAAGGSGRRRRVVRRALLAVAGVVVLSAGVIGIGGWMLAAPRYQGPTSDHFDGARFHNPVAIPHAGFGDLLRWQLNRQRGPWTGHPDAPPGPPPPTRVGRGALRVTFVNHATVLIQMDGLNVLTDPIWSERASPVRFAGPRRRRPPGIRFEDLPPIDLVIVSHNHYDHMDAPTLRRLAAAHRPRIAAGLGNGALLAREGIAGAVELDWWQGIPVSAAGGAEMRLTAVPAQHFSQRGLGDRDRTLWTGYVLSGPAGAVYFAGDTGFGPHFRQVRERFGAVRLALLPIGAYRPEWFMSGVHVSPDGALEAHRVLGAGTSAAIHFGTFELADDGEAEPPARLAALLAGLDPRPRFWVLGFGEGRDVP
jgi:L-ascorbate metabolism protein UlaG (beta-lactamase superfamily)